MPDPALHQGRSGEMISWSLLAISAPMPGGCDLCACVQEAGRDTALPRKISGETRGTWHCVRGDKKTSED